MLADDGPYSENIEEAGPVQGQLFIEYLGVRAFAESLTDNSGCTIDRDPAANGLVGTAEEGFRQGRVACIDSGHGEGVLLAHEFVGTQLTLAGKISVSEVVAVEALVRAAERTIENGEGEARRYPM